ncbi:hypothetical protein HanRHA438_Chr06g0274861 [Helianthus annuus]|nr:hypothetical protein HanRHA438_Chr06g0274861 [Helianthus annuus]
MKFFIGPRMNFLACTKFPGKLQRFCIGPSYIFSGSGVKCNLTELKILTMKLIIQLLSLKFEPYHMTITIVSSKVR